MKAVSLVLIFIFSCGKVEAQAEQINIASALSDFIGEWKGEGWHYHSPEKTNYFEQTCSISSKLDGEVLLVEQKGTLKNDSSQVIFQEVSIWSMHEDDRTIISQQYRAASVPRGKSYLLENGRLIEMINGGQIKFIRSISSDNELLTNGYRIQPNGEEKLFFKMTLTRQ